MSSTTSSTGIVSEAPVSIQYIQDNHQNRPPPLPMAAYMNIDISNDASPLSPSHSFTVSTPLRDDTNEIDTNHAYMNINPGNENIDLPTTGIKIKKLRPLLTSLSGDFDDNSRHCYANLEPGEIENLRMMIPTINSCNTDKLSSSSPSLPPTTPSGESIKEVNYAILDLDKNNIVLTNDNNSLVNNTLPSPPDSPSKSSSSGSYPQKGYATIDFNKTAALSHSVNPNVVNDNEGSRKTRHNSTINDLNSPTRQSSSISE